MDDDNEFETEYGMWKSIIDDIIEEHVPITPKYVVGVVSKLSLSQRRSVAAAALAASFGNEKSLEAFNNFFTLPHPFCSKNKHFFKALALVGHIVFDTLYRAGYLDSSCSAAASATLTSASADGVEAPPAHHLKSDFMCYWATKFIDYRRSLGGYNSVFTGHAINVPSRPERGAQVNCFHSTRPVLIDGIDLVTAIDAAFVADEAPSRR